MFRKRYKQVLSPTTQQEEEVINYYRQAGPDYAAWSEKLHMHLGYYQRGLQFLYREQMLDAMVDLVFSRLGLSNDQSNRQVVDLGCGVGASLRRGAKRFPNYSWLGVTLVPDQVLWGEMLNRQLAPTATIKLQEGNFESLDLPSGSTDYVYALESMSHANGEDKALLIAEIHRILKPGGRFVIADGFIRQPPATLPNLLRACHDELCRGWALPVMSVLPAVDRTLRERGFENLCITDLSWRVAPSVAHVPHVTGKFILKHLLRGEKLNAARRNHLKSCVLTGITGLSRRYFTYCLICGNKPFAAARR